MKKLIPNILWKNKTRFSISFLLIILLAHFGLAQVNIFDAYQQEIAIGDYEFTDCNTGVKRSTHDPLNEGKVLYVAKMATWCPHCKDNTKANFNKDIVAELQNQHKGKLEVWLMFDGPTDCNGAKATQEAVNLKGADIHLFVDNNDVSSKFYSSGAPTILVFDPKTKRSVFQNWEYSSSFPAATKAMKEVLDGTYQFPVFGIADNIAFKKPIKVSSTRDAIASQAIYVVDNKIGTAWQSELNKAQGAWCVIDLQSIYTITSVNMRIGNSNDSKLIKLQISDNENGPWKDISEIKPFNTILSFRIAANSKGRYFRVLNAEANSGWVLSLSDLVVKGTLENTTSIDENLNTQNSSIYPNPASEQVTINSLIDNSRMEIINSVGAIVVERNLVKGANIIDVKSFPKGIYFAKIYNNSNQPELTKLIIE
ncbi:MAG: T9SS C-terminal target domain-containing protein [Cytophagales bacterium]|nr:MAG: T9SS C-terminal target domain-containing protein [Cytophagales bacterium]